jgi:hypothetical protein
MFPLVIQLSQLRDKQNILQKFEQMMQPSPILPKMALNINWDALYPEEKAVFAEMFGRQDLAQLEMQKQNDPSYVTKAKEGITKTQIKAQADMQKNQQDPRKSGQELELERSKHEMEMVHKQQKHQLEMSQKAEQAQLNQYFDGIKKRQEIINAQNNQTSTRQNK